MVKKTLLSPAYSVTSLSQRLKPLKYSASFLNPLALSNRITHIAISRISGSNFQKIKYVKGGGGGKDKDV